MSLFRAREWWSTVSGFEEFHDLGCLCAANIDNSPDCVDKIIIGSFQGLIRIYSPFPPAFSPAHLLLEMKTEAPVLQVAAGQLQKGSQLTCLAALHPRMLTVFALSSMVTDSETLYSLTPLYKHSLTRTAANMVVGPFGKVKACDYICVQSMDGQLVFFHHDSPAFSCFLPDFLLPGPLAYLPRTDSILTANSSMTLQAFRYQTLSAAGSSEERERSHSTSGKRVLADWTADLGEHVVQVGVVSTLGGPSQVLVLGERSVFCFQDSGVLKFMKKLDFNPSCCYGYSILPPQGGEEGPGVVQYLVASHSGQLLVMRDSALVWTASLPHPPADITVADFKGLSGVIVSLDELGHLNCSYLGTDPSSFSPTLSTSRELNYEDVDREMKELSRQIREIQEEQSVPVSANLVMSAEVEGSPRVLEMVDGEEETSGGGGGGGVRKCVEIKVQLSSGSLMLRDVEVNVSSLPPLTSHPSHLHFAEVLSNSPVTHTITVVCTPSLLPSSLHFTLSATYTLHNGTPGGCDVTVPLPLSLFCQPCPPSKVATHKVTLDTNHPALSLHTLFPDLRPPDGEDVPHNAMGFSLLCGPQVTVVASKSSERYRLQSESFPALALFVPELVSRLEKHMENKEPPFLASFSGPLPLNEYFELIDNHFMLRKNLEQCGELLARHAQQFRSIQKRLLTRFKDKTPVGLAHLDTLLDGTFMQLMALGEKNEEFQQQLGQCSSELSAATLLIITLLRLSVHMPPSDYAVLKASLCPIVNTDADQGWEEQTDAAITHLLKTTLAKGSREQSVTTSSMDMPLDSHRLKRHIALLCDRISKGGVLTPPSSVPPTSTPPTSTPPSSTPPTHTGPMTTRSLTPQGKGVGPVRPEVLSHLPLSHSPQRSLAPSLPSLPEHSAESDTPPPPTETDV